MAWSLPTHAAHDMGNSEFNSPSRRQPPTEVRLVDSESDRRLIARRPAYRGAPGPGHNREGYRHVQVRIRYGVMLVCRPAPLLPLTGQ